MKSNKIIIEVAPPEQQENLKSVRKTLKVLQESAHNKENLAGRLLAKDGKSDVESMQNKKKKLLNKSVQTEEAAITAEDLTDDEPSVEYWKKMAEMKSDLLDTTLHENESLREEISGLQQENRLCKEMIDESKHLIEVLKEMIEETDTSTDVIDEVNT